MSYATEKRTLLGTSAKRRRGTGWGGKGSFHPTAQTAAAKWWAGFLKRFGYMPASLQPRRYEGYQKRGGYSPHMINRANADKVKRQAKARGRTVTW